jgi:hypothetical protein
MTAKERAKDTRLKREYHITLEEHKAVFKYQGGVCAICKKILSKKNVPLILAVDHSHTHPAIVRGLLCWPCNKALAYFQDSVDKLKAAVAYLEHPPFTVVLGEPRLTAPGRIGSKARAKLLKKMKLLENI